MEAPRPDPDQLLEEWKKDAAPTRGRLKIFLGYAAGVGKTYAMLQAAQQLKRSSEDVVVGYVEPHARPETQEQLEGLATLPPLAVPHKGLVLKELDLDACLKRKPTVLLVDELAHTNAPGLRHEKRWQDVQEILESGISVYTTLNIQHLDSMNDIVADFSGILVKETLPDQIFDEADEVEVVDLPPEELLLRLQKGKIYSVEQAGRALKQFFKESNLLALREMALRRTADRVGREVDSAREKAKVQEIWPVRERLLVSVGPSPTSEDLLRGAARMASKLDAKLIAVYIETPQKRVMGEAARNQLQKNLATAGNLGAETVVLQGSDVGKDLIGFARLRNVTQIVLGKNRDASWLRPFKRTIGDELLRISGDIDIYILTGRAPERKTEGEARRPFLKARHAFWTVGISAVFLGLCELFKFLGMGEYNIVLTFLFGVVTAAGFFGFSASLLASVLAVLEFNFFFIPPIFTFSVDDPQFYLVFLFILAVGAIIGLLAERLQSQTEFSRSREQRMETLNRLNRELSRKIERADIVKTAVDLIGEILETETLVFVDSADMERAGMTAKDTSLFLWVLQNGKRAGWGTATLRDSAWQVWPLEGTAGVVGVLVLRPLPDKKNFSEEKSLLIEALAAAVTSALERAELVEEGRQAVLEIDAERSRNTLLQGLSHDLRTPLAVISGSSSTLIDSARDRLSVQDKELLGTIFHESQWMGRQVENLLSLTRLDSGLPGKLQWVPAEEIVLSCLARFRELFPAIPISWTPPDGWGLCWADPVLLEQALFNLLENGALYAPSPAGLEVVMESSERDLKLSVKDRGRGVPPAEKQEIFRKFTRGEVAKTLSRRGTGLGLALVQIITRIHGGTCGIDDRPGGGSVFWINLPLPAEKPSLPPEES